MPENQRVNDNSSPPEKQPDNGNSGLSDFVQQMYSPTERTSPSVGSDSSSSSSNTIDRSKQSVTADGGIGEPQFLNMDTGAVETGEASSARRASSAEGGSNQQDVDGNPIESPQTTNTEQQVAQRRAGGPEIAQIGGSPADSTKPTDAKPETARQPADATGTREQPFGSSTLKFDGNRLTSITLPTGQEIKRNADGKFESPTGGIKSVEVNPDKKQIEINWEPKNGVTETTKLTRTGMESTYDKPSTKLGVENVTSIEMTKDANGKDVLNVRKDSGEVIRMAKDAESGRFKQTEKLPAPADMTKEDLAKGAQEMARLIAKNGGSSFGDAGDQKYFKDMQEQYQKLKKSFDFEDDVNKALGPNAKVDFREHSIRNGELSFSLNDKKTGRGTDQIHVRDGWKPLGER